MKSTKKSKERYCSKCKQFGHTDFEHDSFPEIYDEIGNLIDDE